MKKIIFLLCTGCILTTNAYAQPILGEAQMIENSTDCDVDLHIGCVELDGCEIYELAGPAITAPPVTSTPLPPSGCPYGSYVIYYVTWSHPGCAGIQSGVFVDPNIPAWILAKCGYNQPSTSSLPGCPYNGCNNASYPVWWSTSLPNTIEVGP